MAAQPNNRKNNVVGKDQRRHKVAALYCEGKTQVQIAQYLGVSQPTICADLAAIRQEWQESSLRDFDHLKAQELAKLDHLEAVAWQAWARSTEDAQTTTARTEQGRILDHRRRPRLVPVKVVTNTQSKGQAGDPRFLDQVRECITLRMKVIGALRPDNTTNVQVNSLAVWDVLAGVNGQGTVHTRESVEEEMGRRLAEAVHGPERRP